MWAFESPFERYMSERILSFAYLMCPSVSRPKALKKCLRFAMFNFCKTWQNMFEIGLKKIWSVRTKIEIKIRRQGFVVYVLIYPLSKFESNRTNSLRGLAFYNVRFKWKNWFDKTALNMSIRQVIFTSGQNFKPPFFCQYLIFCSIFLYVTRLHLDHLKEIVDLQVYCNLKGLGNLAGHVRRHFWWHVPSSLQV